MPHSQSKNKPVLNVDDDDLYVVHGEGQGEGPAININRFREHMIVESSSEEEETTSSDEVDGQVSGKGVGGGGGGGYHAMCQAMQAKGRWESAG